MERCGKYSTEIAFEQIFSIPRLVGTYPLDCNYKLSWKLLIYSIDSIFSFILALNDFTNPERSIRSYLALFRWCLLMPASFINFACLYFKLERLMDLFKELVAFEQYCHRIGVPWNYQRKWWNRYLSLLVVMSTISGWFYNFNLILFMRITFRRIHVYIVFYTIIDQVTGTTSLLASAIAHLKYLREDLELLRKFGQLILLCRTVEDYFGPQLLAITAWSFVSSISLIFWFTISSLNAFQTACLFLLTVYPLLVIYIPFLSIVHQVSV